VECLSFHPDEGGIDFIRFKAEFEQLLDHFLLVGDQPLVFQNILGDEIDDS